MKKVVLTLLAVIVSVGLLAAAGFAGYRIGYRQGALTTNTQATNNAPFMHGFVHPDIPMQNFGRNLERGFGRGIGPMNFGMRGGGFGFGLFGPLMFLGRILFWALVVLFIYWLFTKSGWQLIRKPQPAVATPNVESAPIETPSSEEKAP